MATQSNGGGPLRSAWHTFRRFAPLARPDRRILIFGGLLAVFAAGCEVAAVYVFGVITDTALAEKSLSAYWSPAAIWLLAAVVGAAATFVSDYLTELAGERFLFRLRNRVFGHVQKLPLDFFDNNRLGDLMTRLTDDVESVEALVASGVVRFVTAIISVVAFAVAAFLVRWDLALVACALVPLFWLVSRGFTGRVQEAAVEERASNGTIAGVVEESLSNQAVVQAYNQQASEEARLYREGSTWLRARMAEARLSSLYGPLVQVVETLCVLVVLGVGAWELSESRITLGGLLSFAAFLGYLYPPMQTLGSFVLTSAEASAAVDRLDEVTTTEPAVTDDGAPDSGWRGSGRVDVTGVTFRYPGADRPTVERLSFDADPGQLVLLSGPSGAGKSTVTKLLLRFYDPTAGQILLDGVDIREMSLRTLRENVTLLHQDSQLFAGSVAANIAYGRPAATAEDVVRAARAADAHDFVIGLPEGYDTDIGHRGRLLSGGQRQRVAIARALLRDTPILVLDEPTTGLDRESALRIMEPLRRLMTGRTTILITHDVDLPLTPDVVVPVNASRETPTRPPSLTPSPGTSAILPAPTLTGILRAVAPSSRIVGRANLTARPTNSGRITLPHRTPISGRARVTTPPSTPLSPSTSLPPPTPLPLPTPIPFSTEAEAAETPGRNPSPTTTSSARANAAPQPPRPAAADPAPAMPIRAGVDGAAVASSARAAVALSAHAGVHGAAVVSPGRAGVHGGGVPSSGQAGVNRAVVASAGRAGVNGAAVASFGRAAVDGAHVSSGRAGPVGQAVSSPDGTKANVTAVAPPGRVGVNGVALPPSGRARAIVPNNGSFGSTPIHPSTAFPAPAPALAQSDGGWTGPTPMEPSDHSFAEPGDGWPADTSSDADDDRWDRPHGWSDRDSHAPDVDWSGTISAEPGERWSGRTSVGPGDEWSGQTFAEPDVNWPGSISMEPDERWSGQTTAGPGDEWSGQISVGPDHGWSGQISVGPDDDWSGRTSAGPGDSWSGRVDAVRDDGWAGQASAEPGDGWSGAVGGRHHREVDEEPECWRSEEGGAWQAGDGRSGAHRVPESYDTRWLDGTGLRGWAR